MNKSQLSETVYKKCLQNKSGGEKKNIALAKDAVNLFFQDIQSALKSGDRVEIRGLGSFVMKDYEPYTGRNPRTGEKIQVEAKRLPYFKGGKNLRDLVNQD